MIPNIPENTGIQDNRGHSLTDDFITRTYVLPLLTDPDSKARIIAEHKENPIGVPGKGGNAAIGHSDDLSRVLDKLRRAPMTGKMVRVCVDPHKGYIIGICSGVRGQPVELLQDETYPSEEACEHEIFIRRVENLLAEYGYK